MALLRLLLAHLRSCERPVVHRLHRILETPGSRPERSLGRQRCFQNRRQEKGL